LRTSDQGETFFSIQKILTRSWRWPEYRPTQRLSNQTTPIIKTLLIIGYDLLEQGLDTPQIEERFFSALTMPSGPDLPARRVRLFRSAIGSSGPSSKDRASDLADAVARPLRGGSDLAFQRRMLLAHLRGLLFQQAHDSAGDLRRDSIEVTRENLKSALMFAVVYAKPKSDLVPWPLGDREASSMINVVVTDYFGQS
jgi:hypothetical protein